MEAPPKNIEPPPTTPSRKRVRRLRVVLAMLIVLSLAATVLLFLQPAESEMTWLTPTAVQQAGKPGVLKTAWYRVRGMIGPLNRLFSARPKALLRLDSSIYLFPTSPTKLGAPTATNADGMRAWIIPADSLGLLRAEVSTLPGGALMSSPRMQTADGVRSQMSVGATMIAGGKITPVGLTVDVLPKIMKDSVRLVVSIVDSQNDESSIKTNFSVACAATIPDTGALVIDTGDAEKNHHWIVLSPILVDAKGKPIKH